MSDERNLFGGAPPPQTMRDSTAALRQPGALVTQPQGAPIAVADGTFWLGMVGVTETGLIFDARASESDWQAFQTGAKKLTGLSTWLWCDYYAFGADALKKSYADMAAAVGKHKPATVESYASIGRGVGQLIRINFRSTTLKLAHFRLVAALPEAAQATWLQKALANDWSQRQLKAALAGKKPPPPRKKRGKAVTLAQARAGVQKLAAAVKPEARAALAAHLRQLADELEREG